MKNVLEWLKTTVEKYPDKPAFSDTECSITFAQVYDIARNTGAYLVEQLGVDRTPVAVFAGRKMVTPAYFLGVVYAGRPYAPIDSPTEPSYKTTTWQRQLPPVRQSCRWLFSRFAPYSPNSSPSLNILVSP